MCLERAGRVLRNRPAGHSTSDNESGYWNLTDNGAASQAGDGIKLDARKFSQTDGVCRASSTLVRE